MGGGLIDRDPQTETYPGQRPPCGQTNASENITFPQLCFSPIPKYIPIRSTDHLKPHTSTENIAIQILFCWIHLIRREFEKNSTSV